MSYISGLHSLNGCCMGFFWKGSRFQFLEFVFENLEGFFSPIEYVLGYIGRGGSLHLHILWEII